MKKFLNLFAKAFVSVALLWYLLSNTEFSEVLASLKSAIPLWLVFSFITLYIGKILTSYRWQVLLEAQGIRIPLRTLIASVFVGQFFNSFLPTTVGGDAIRAYDTAAHSKESGKSITTVFADRLIGVFALAILALLAIFFGFLIRADVSFFVWPVAAVFSVCLAGILFFLSDTLANFFDRLLRKYQLGKIADKIYKAYLSLHSLKDKTRVLWVAFLISIALQVNVVLFYYFIGVSLDLGVSLLYFFIIVPVALIILIVPFSINGIGLREGIFVFLLTGLAVPSQHAIALSLLSFFLTLTQGVLGGIIFALRGTDLDFLSTFRSIQKSPANKE